MRTKIMNGARTLFREQGYSNVTMRAIGRKVGCSAAAIYRHFRNKREIMDALRHEGFERMLLVLQGELLSTDPCERLVQLGKGYVRFATNNPESFALMYNLAGQVPEEDFVGVPEPKESYEYFMNVVDESVRSGRLGENSTETVMLSIWTVVHGLSCLINCGRLQTVYGAVDEQELVDTLLRFVVCSKGAEKAKHGE